MQPSPNAPQAVFKIHTFPLPALPTGRALAQETTQTSVRPWNILEQNKVLHSKVSFVLTIRIKPGGIRWYNPPISYLTNHHVIINCIPSLLCLKSSKLIVLTFFSPIVDG